MKKPLFSFEISKKPYLQRWMPEKSGPLELTGRHLAARIAVGILTSFWIVFLPTYLVVIYMGQNGMLSYDFIVDAAFANKIVVIVSGLLFLGLSILCYGWIPCYRTGLAHYRDTQKVPGLLRVAFVCFFAVSALMHGLILNHALGIGSAASAAPPLVICLSLAIFIALHIGRDPKASVVDWVRPVGFFLVTLAAPICFPKPTSEFVAAGLSAFRVGGSIAARVKSKTDAEVVFAEGKLILLGPSTVYIRAPDEHLHIIPIDDNALIEIGRSKRRANEP